ncbi:MAG: hypothetical protein ACUVUC_05275 [Thermoguttaceae bacterium]
MKAWQTAVLVLVGLAAGCRTDPAITHLERENRYLEDVKYALEDELLRAEEELESCRQQNEALRRAQRRPDRAGRRPEAVREPQLAPPRLPARPEELQDELPPVIIETPAEPSPPGEIPRPPQAPAKAPGSSSAGQTHVRPSGQEARVSEAPRFVPDRPPPAATPSAPDPEALKSGTPGRSASPGSSRSPQQGASRFNPGLSQGVVPIGGNAIVPRGDSAEVDRITLNRLLTSGWDMDDRPGDEGIIVVLEPRDAQGRPVAAAAPVSVVLLDRGLPGEAARVARWDLDAQQVAAQFRQMPSGEAIYLELPWPGPPPVHSHLHLFVRYTTRDGRKLEANRELDIALEGQGGQWREPLRPTGPELGSPAPASAWRPRPLWPAPGEDAADRPGEDAGALPLAAGTPSKAESSWTADSSNQQVRRRQTARRPRPVWSPDRR